MADNDTTIIIDSQTTLLTIGLYIMFKVQYKLLSSTDYR